jgi:hypothetical protein
MKPEQRHLRAKDQAVRDYLRGPYKTYKAPPGLGRNVIGVGIGHKNYDPDPKAELCVHCYVERKLDPGAIPEGFLIKKTLGGVLTDVIETGRFVAFQGDNVAAPGSSIGLNYLAPNVDPTITGTLGGFVKIGPTLYVLGSNHAMMVNGRVPAGTRILFKPPDQFIDDPNRYVFARTTAYVPLIQAGPNYPNNVDCALAEVENPDLVETQFPNQIVEFGDPVDPEAHMQVSRVDATDPATGVITGVNVHMPIDYRFGTYDFDDLVLIEGDNGQFAKPGDSGAILVDQVTHKATALVIGGSSKYTIACPLATVFRELTTVLAKQTPVATQPTPRGNIRMSSAPPKIELVVNSLRDGGSSRPASATGGGQP